MAHISVRLLLYKKRPNGRFFQKPPLPRAISTALFTELPRVATLARKMTEITASMPPRNSVPVAIHFLYSAGIIVIASATKQSNR